jgi:hypothetical protein
MMPRTYERRFHRQSNFGGVCAIIPEFDGIAKSLAHNPRRRESIVAGAMVNAKRLHLFAPDGMVTESGLSTRRTVRETTC